MEKRRAATLTLRLTLVGVLLAVALAAGLYGVMAGYTKAEMIALWPAAAPGAVGNQEADRPTISVYLPMPGRRSGTAVVICPGGAFRLLMASYEGEAIAHWLNSFGVAAFVLRYRLAPRYRYPAPLEDAQRAMRVVRANAARFGVRPDRIGVIGFSAGGHVAAMLLTHFDRGHPGAVDRVERESSRPDFGLLAYAITTFQAPYTFGPGVTTELGASPGERDIEGLSPVLQVTRDTPPTFLMHTEEDAAVAVENSVMFYNALRKAGVPGELLVYQNGPHGAGLGNGFDGAPRRRAQAMKFWSLEAERWLAANWMPYRPLSLSAVFRL